MLHRWKLAKEIRNIVLEKEILLYGNRDICQYYPISSILMRHADIKLTEMPILNTVPFQLNSHFEFFTSTILRFHAYRKRNTGICRVWTETTRNSSWYCTLRIGYVSYTWNHPLEKHARFLQCACTNRMHV